MLNSIKRFLYTVSIMIVPMLFGSFFFVGILESYRNTESFNSAILESYGAIRKKRTQCHKIHNELYLAYYPYAENIKVMRNELAMFIETKGRNLPQEYEVFMTFIGEQNSRQAEEIAKLKIQKEECYADLYISYEEAAILLNLIEEYEAIAAERYHKNNELNSAQKNAADKVVNSMSSDDIMNVVRVGMESAFISNKDMWFATMETLTEFQMELAKIEEKRFDADLEVFGKLRKLYLEAITVRLNRGFVDYLMQ